MCFVVHLLFYWVINFIFEALRSSKYFLMYFILKISIDVFQSKDNFQLNINTRDSFPPYLVLVHSLLTTLFLANVILTHILINNKIQKAHNKFPVR